jgi:hypothetical protein
MLVFYLYVVIFLSGYYPRVFLPGRVWVWDNMYTQVRVWVRVWVRVRVKF